MPFYLPSVFKVNQFTDCDMNTIVSLITGSSLSQDSNAINSKSNYDKIMNIGISVRACKTKKERDNLKKGLPAFGVGNFNLTIDKNGFKETDLMMFDVDGLDSQALRSLKDRLREFACFYFTTASGKGLKFVIRLNRHVNEKDFLETKKQHKAIFTSILNIPVDEAYNAYHTYLAIDKEAFYNPYSITFDTFTHQLIEKYDNLNLKNVVDDEIMDIARAFYNVNLNNAQWTTIALCFASAGQRAEIPFKSIEQYDKQNCPVPGDHDHRDYNKKWEWCINNVKELTIASLFYYAELWANYVRKPDHIVAGIGIDFPFPVTKDGQCVTGTGSTAELAFSFNQVEYLYNIEVSRSDTGGTNYEYAFQIKGKSNGIVKMSPTDLNNPADFKKKLSGMATTDTHPIRCFTGVPNQERVIYKKLSKYFLDKATERGIMATIRPGIGCISTVTEWDKFGYTIWNFGTHVLVCKRTPKGYTSELTEFSAEVPIDDSYVALLENHTHSPEFSDFGITANKKLKSDVKKMFSFYGDNTYALLGWIIAQSYYKYYLQQDFPLLYLSGSSGSGKTCLARILLSMYGAAGRKSQSIFLVNSTAHLTETFLTRIKERANCIPVAVDEISRDKNSVNMILSGFDGQGKNTAIKTMDNRTKSTQVNCGGIFMSIYKPNEFEANNRCFHISLSENDDKGKARDFQNYMRNSKELSYFIAYVHTKISPDKMRQLQSEAMDKMIDLLSDIPHIQDREITNYSYVYAGYMALQSLGFCDELDSDWWYGHANTATLYKEENTNVANILLTLATGLASDSYKGKWDRIVYGKILRDTGGTKFLHLFLKLGDTALLNELKTQLGRVNPHSPIQSLNQIKLALTESELLQPYYIKSKNRFVKIASRSMYGGIHDYSNGEPVIRCRKCGEENKLSDKSCSSCASDLLKSSAENVYEFKIPYDENDDYIKPKQGEIPF